MKEPIGIKQIAKMADVSIGTVDRVLHNRPGVSSRTQERVRSIIKTTGYKRNAMASRLKLAANKKIKLAVLIPEVSHAWSYWEIPKKGIDRAVGELNELGIEVDYYYFSGPQGFREEIHKIIALDYKGLVTVSFFKDESNLLLALAKAKKMSVVFLDTEIALDGPTNFIRQNAHQAGMVAARLLFGLVGEKGLYIVINIAHAHGLHANNQQRENGFREFFNSNFSERPIAIKTFNHPLDNTFELSEAIETALMDKRPKGIFVTNARSYMMPPVLKSLGVKNASLLGFDLNQMNVECLQKGELNFLIDQKPEYQGYSAIKGLFNYHTQQSDCEPNIDIPIEIIVRENCPPLDDPIVAHPHPISNRIN
ncbi:MAG: LacI family DNA-binding transcriptional regulator [Sediminicola sp.]